MQNEPQMGNLSASYPTGICISYENANTHQLIEALSPHAFQCCAETFRSQLPKKVSYHLIKTMKIGGQLSIGLLQRNPSSPAVQPQIYQAWWWYESASRKYNVQCAGELTILIAEG